MDENVPDTNETPVQAPPQKGRGIRKWLLIIGGLVVVLPVLAMFLWSVIALKWSYSEGERAGYVQKFSKKGWLCKTYEGEIAMVNIPGQIANTFQFTVRDDSIAALINAAQGKRVALT